MTARWSPPPHPGPPLVITPRMADVLTCLCRGMSTEEIAGDLFLAENTVRRYLMKLRLEADAKDRAHLVAVAVQRMVIVHDRRKGAA